MKRLGALILLILLAGCESVPIKGISPELDTVATGIEATSKAARPISDEEEYYVGRAVAARILSTYHLLNDRELTNYVNLIGQAIALESERPYTYGGYHFAILDTNEVNAFACPGGIIFITKGIIHAVRSEDELAAVLAHETAHINHRDGIGAIKRARWTEAVTIIGTQTAKQYGSADLAKLVSLFEGSIDDVFKTLVVNGYSQTQESNADATALIYLAQSGYDPHALEDFLNRIVEQGKGSRGGILKTHPATAERIENVMRNMPSERPDIVLVQMRTKRFRGIAE